MLKWYFLLTHHAMQNAEASDTAIVIPRFTLLYCKDRGTLGIRNSRSISLLKNTVTLMEYS